MSNTNQCCDGVCLEIYCLGGFGRHCWANGDSDGQRLEIR